jgi:hypothetical protein
MNNKRTKAKTAILGGMAAISLLSPLAHAQIIFFDDFTEDYTAASGGGGYQSGLSGTKNDLTNAPAGAPSNDLNWTSNYTVGSGQYGAGILSDVGYPSGTKATNGSETELYIVPGGGYATSGISVDVSTPILTGSDTAVDLVPGASYTLSLDVGFRTDQTVSDLGIDLFAGSTLLDASPSTGGYTDEVTPTASQQKSGIFKNYSFTIPASALVGDSGALRIELVNPANENQVNLSNIVISESLPEGTIPEPGTWAMMLGGLGALVFFQRMRRGHKV